MPRASRGLRDPSPGIGGTRPSHGLPAFLPALLAIAGLALLQALIGGRVLLFAFPGYCFIAIAGLVSLAFASSSRTRADPLCLYGTGIFLGYILLRAIATPGYYARPDLLAALGALAVYGLTVTAVTSSNTRAAIVAALLMFSLIHVLIGLIQFSRGDNFMLIPFLQRVDYGQRASGFYVCPNHLAGLLEVIGIFAVSLICWGRWPVWGKVLTGWAACICYLGVAITGSRGGYLSTMASVLTFAGISLFVMRLARPERFLRVGAIAVIALLGFGLLCSVLFHRSSYLTQRAGMIIDPKNMRVDLWRAALQQWKLQPIVGTGSGSYRFYGRQFRATQMQNDPIDVHNDYLHLLCEYGLIGAGAFLAFFGVHARQASRSLTSLAHRAGSGSALSSHRLALLLGAIAAVAAYVVHSILDFNLHIPANAMLFAFVFGLLANPGFEQTSRTAQTAISLVPRLAIAAASMALLAACLRLFPGEYFTEKARTSLRDEDPLAAIAYANKALGYERSNPNVLFYLSRASIAASRSADDAIRLAGFEKAIASLEEARRLAPLDGSYPLDLAFAYDEIKRFSEAEKMYDAARSRDPHSTAVSEMYRAHRESWERSEQPPL